MHIPLEGQAEGLEHKGLRKKAQQGNIGARRGGQHWGVSIPR